MQMSNMSGMDVSGFGNKLFICWCSLSATNVSFHWPLLTNVDNYDNTFT